jgi:hypothetical protein
MKLSSLIYTFATFMAALAADTEDHKDQVPSPLVTIRPVLQCREKDNCKIPASTPVLTQIKDNVTIKSSSANYTDQFKDLPEYTHGRWIGEVTLNKSLAGTQDFRIDGEHLFKGENPVQLYNLAVSNQCSSRPQ